LLSSRACEGLDKEGSVRGTQGLGRRGTLHGGNRPRSLEDDGTHRAVEAGADLLKRKGTRGGEGSEGLTRNMEEPAGRRDRQTERPVNCGGETSGPLVWRGLELV
jgi:hypothetical protein